MAAAGSVVAYNYMDATMYDGDSGIGDYWVDMGINGSHFTGSHHMLFEGNWGTSGQRRYAWQRGLSHLFSQLGHGAAVDFHRPFARQNSQRRLQDRVRMRDDGTVRLLFGPAGSIARRWADDARLLVCLCRQRARDFEVTTSANGWTYNGNLSTNDHIWMVGWNADAAHPTDTDPNLTASVGAFIFRHGNYDYVDGKIADWTSGYSQTLPNSFYLSSAPSSSAPEPPASIPGRG